ncbi:MAG: dihydroorotate dehydrogenase-like protein [Pirellulaceae bacterium]
MSNSLAATYLGLELSSPLVVGACPLNIEPETVRQLVDAGAGAIVLPSMLQEQIDYRNMKASDPTGALQHSGYQPQQDKYNGGVDCYLKSIESIKKTCGVPLIGSLNGSGIGDWIGYAKEIESAGADALEFNPQSVFFDVNEDANSIESRLCDLIHHVADSVLIPLAVKVTQRYTNLASISNKLNDAGAKGVVLFTHLPQWDVSTDRMHWTIRWELSPVDSLGGILEGIVRVRGENPALSIAASGGVSSGEDAIKAIIAGADVAMVTSAVYREGPEVIRQITDGIRRHLELSSYQSLSEFCQARPIIDASSKHQMRLQYVDPLTRSGTYFDPSPSIVSGSGDAFGHKV